MHFGRVATRDATGCLLAHSLKTSTGRLRKGRCLETVDIAALLESGHESVIVARLGEADVHEDVAAAQVAEALVGEAHNLRLSRASTGRVNVFARATGLLGIARERILAANRVDEGITIATLAENRWVAAGRLVATVKIIPFAVAADAIGRVCDAFVSIGSRDDSSVAGCALSLHTPRPLSIALLHTTLPGLRDTVIEKTARVTAERIVSRGLRLTCQHRCLHDTDALTGAIAEIVTDAPDALLIVGASAIGDRRDVVPAAIERTGGVIERFGLPVDPGNLLLLAHLDGCTILGLPGCARSARDNGLDRVLDRVACGLPLDQTWLESLAVGGLLDEIVERPAPRILPREGTPEPDRIAAILLAAGASRRAGATNKLLYPVDGVPMIARIAATLSRSTIDRLIVVIGHEADAVVEAIEQNANTASPLARSSVQFCHNEAHASGMASSLVHGLSAASDNHAAVLICLGDMPDIDVGLIDQLLDAWRALPASDRYRRIVVPVFEGRRGNPVVIGRVFFDLLLALQGDIGARSLIASHPGAVLEVAVDSDAILIDHDTLDELQARNAGSP